MVGYANDWLVIEIGIRKKPTEPVDCTSSLFASGLSFFLKNLYKQQLPLLNMLMVFVSGNYCSGKFPQRKYYPICSHSRLFEDHTQSTRCRNAINSLKMDDKHQICWGRGAQ